VKSAIILAGGRSVRFGGDKGLLPLDDRTLIEHVYGKVASVAREVVIAVRSKSQRKAYSQLVRNCLFVLDEWPGNGPLNGLWSGLKRVTGEKVAVVGCDMPLVSPELMRLLYELSWTYDAVIPRWPSGYIEPLHSVYDVDRCRTATTTALRKGRSDMRAMILSLARVLYLSTEAIRKIDSDLNMFVNINTHNDLLRTKRILGSQMSTSSPRVCHNPANYP